MAVYDRGLTEQKNRQEQKKVKKIRNLADLKWEILKLIRVVHSK